MAKSKINKRFEQYVLRGKLRQEGFERWRYVFTAISSLNSRERKFFVELYIVNPASSPKAVVISQKSRLAISESDLQYALAGTESATHANDELDVKPSYVLVKAGVFGEGGKHMNKFLASSQFAYVKNSDTFKVADCTFSSRGITGSVLVTSQDLRVRPELLCSVGSMDWSLQFERNIESKPLCNRKNQLWIPIGASTSFSGTIHLDNEEFIVIPKSCNGYTDKSWGVRPNSPYFHVSSSSLTSIISGRLLPDSCIVLDGEYNGRLCAYAKLENIQYKIADGGRFKRKTIIHDCSQVSDNVEGDKVHWSASVHKGKIVIDIDVYCRGKDSFVRDYEMPQGKRCLLKVLGGVGRGEIRVYKKVKKNLELLEHATISDAVCEFGQTEEVGK